MDILLTYKISKDFLEKYQNKIIPKDELNIIKDQFLDNMILLLNFILNKKDKKELFKQLNEYKISLDIEIFNKLQLMFKEKIKIWILYNKYKIYCEKNLFCDFNSIKYFTNNEDQEKINYITLRDNEVDLFIAEGIIQAYKLYLLTQKNTDNKKNTDTYLGKRKI